MSEVPNQNTERAETPPNGATISGHANHDQTPRDNTINLRVKTIDSREFNVTCLQQASVLDFKRQLHALSNVPTERQRLIFRGSVLQDTQNLQSLGIEDGFTLHLVERPSDFQSTQASEPSPEQRRHQRININLTDNGTGLGGLLQNLAGQLGNQMHIITHPPMGNQEGAQVVQVVAVAGGQQLPRPPHQLTALNNFLLSLQGESYPNQEADPPFSMIERMGQDMSDEVALREVALAALNGTELSEDLREFLANLRSPATAAEAVHRHTDTDQEAVGNPTDPLGESTEAGARDPRRNGFDAQSRPRARPVSADLLRASTLALSQIARQSTAHLQSFVLPTLATCTQALRDMASQSQIDNQPLTEQARRLSNTAYNVGSMLLELSLAASNLGQAAAGNGGPLLSAQTGFLSSDGTHSHVTNRGLGPLPFMDRQSYSGHIPGAQVGAASAFPGPPMRSTGTDAAANGARQTQSNRQGAVPAAGQPAMNMPAHFNVPILGSQMPRTGGPAGSNSQASGQPASRGRDSESPFAHAFFNAITSEDTSVRHMRLPVRLGNGREFRMDMSYVINAIEVFLLSAPPDQLSQVLQSINPVEDASHIRALMTAPQNDAVRRQLYERYTQPILSTLLTTVESYFEQIYRIVPRRTGEEQAVIRPTRRARNRPLPSLSHPFATIPNPAREALLMHNSEQGFPTPIPSVGGQQSALAIPIPGGQMQIQMSLEEVHIQDLQNRVPGVAFPMPGLRPFPNASASNNTAQPGAQPQAVPIPQPNAQQAVHTHQPRPPVPATPGVAQSIRIPIQFQPGPQARRPQGVPVPAVPSMAAIRSSLPAEPAAPLTGSDLEHLANLCANRPSTVQAFLRAEYNSNRTTSIQPGFLNNLSTRPRSTGTASLQAPARPSSSSQRSNVESSPSSHDSASNDIPSVSSDVGQSPSPVPQLPAVRQGGNLIRTEAQTQPPGLPRLPPRRRASSASGVPAQRVAQAEAAQQGPNQSHSASIDSRQEHSRSEARTDQSTSRPAIAGQVQQVMQGLLSNPGQISALATSPEFQRLAEGPAFEQMMQAMFPGQRPDDPAPQPQSSREQEFNTTQGQGQGQQAGMGSLLRAFMPMVQQVVGGIANQEIGAQPLALEGLAGPNHAGAGYPELDSLPVDEREHWHKVLIKDKRKQVGQDHVEPLSDGYFHLMDSQRERHLRDHNGGSVDMEEID